MWATVNASDNSRKNNSCLIFVVASISVFGPKLAGPVYIQLKRKKKKDLTTSAAENFLRI